ncbi:PHA/PHB synthase family protein [Sphingomonas crocodyli]|uniref:Class I poly(R)-hydroxyalkanoic acid synthase n=1 Tax=Sphingomonas crocodyli TaxID=1979270 RepID=A0A437M8M6_9SPHN|nr:class I poly(R)-hydroxyalkanoic acid synthase [Sphingomonas crocodyli]RVT93844.1 class I poly(R)-hydroxyalkanoic acid synthase [Sphingomonas crocodyli]
MGDLGEDWGRQTTVSELPPLAEIQHWTGVVGQAQQMIMEHLVHAMPDAGSLPLPDMQFPDMGAIMGDTTRLVDLQSDAVGDALGLWTALMKGDVEALKAADRDRRFNAEAWRQTPIFDVIRQAYLLLCEHFMRAVDAIDGVEPEVRNKIRFAMRTVTEAMSPANFPLTNPQVLERIFETRGQNLLRGLEHMLADITKGQLTQVRQGAFELGRNIAATPGKVIHETPLYQLIHYAPTTETVFETPLLIFPAWINRFYILDLNQRNSFVRWAVDQGISVFLVSWKSADESIAGIGMDDYVIGGQIDAIDAVRKATGAESVHTIGYCVAGSVLAMTLAYLAAKGEAGKVASATFFTAQVDFEEAGELKHLLSDELMAMLPMLTGDKGVLDGRFLAASFNLLRARDLIWNYVVQNYLLGEDYPEFDLLHWNNDTTNLPGEWHRDYIQALYRDNRLVQPGALSIAGVPIDLTKILTPAYIQAGREDHIAPAPSVWRIMDHFRGDRRFVLAGSGHVAGVVNPPAAKKYQYWTNPAADSFADFVANAVETPGSWWSDWIGWIADRSGPKVPAKGKRVPGKGPLKAIEDAPGRYVRMR